MTEAIIQAGAEPTNVVRRKKMPAQTPGKSDQDYGTPREFILAVQHRFGRISWDLAAHEGNHVCDLWIGEQQDALSLNWAAELKGVLWLNPPFGDIPTWARKCAMEAKRGARILFLTPASVGTNWFWSHVNPHRDALVLPLSPRLTFVGETNPYPKDLMLSAYGFGTVGFDRWKWRLS